MSVKEKIDSVFANLLVFNISTRLIINVLNALLLDFHCYSYNIE